MARQIEAGTEGTPSWEESVRILRSLPATPMGRRGNTVRCLLRSPERAIRKRTLAIGATMLSDDEIAGLIRAEDDDVARNAGLEILKRRGRHGAELSYRLLDDHDPDVVMMALEALQSMDLGNAAERLRDLLRHPDPNVVQTAIVALGRLGDQSVAPDLVAFLQADRWLRIAAVQALGELRSADAAIHLEQLLDDPEVNMLAAEALARIGGIQAFRTLAATWLGHADEVERDQLLGLLAQVVEGLETCPPESRGVRTALLDLVTARGPRSLPAASILLALGPGRGEHQAVEMLAAAASQEPEPPACLRLRADLVPYLLSLHGPAHRWGISLAARFPELLSRPDLARILSGDEPAEPLEAVVSLLRHKDDGRLAPVLLDLYIRLEPDRRSQLTPLLRRHAIRVLAVLEARDDLDHETRLVLRGLLGHPADEMVSAILELPTTARARVVAQLCDRPDLLQALPWSSWLPAEPEAYAAVVGRIAGVIPETLLPALRRSLAAHPVPAVIRVLGELGDAASVPALITHLDHHKPFVRTTILDALGRIGGTSARRALAQHAERSDPAEARIALLALARCATLDELELYRDNVSHQDWAVRLASADVLGRFPPRDNMDSLLSLATDPVAAVSRRALVALET